MSANFFNIKDPRGFTTMGFFDHYGEKCTIQQSSLATDDCIWLGPHDPRLLSIPENLHTEYGHFALLPAGYEVLSNRMHLSRKQVAQLLPVLQEFVETGSLPPPYSPVWGPTHTEEPTAPWICRDTTPYPEVSISLNLATKRAYVLPTEECS